VFKIAEIWQFLGIAMLFAAPPLEAGDQPRLKKSAVNATSARCLIELRVTGY
jgi:hypothetical protein